MNRQKFKIFICLILVLITSLIGLLGTFAYLKLESESLLKIREDADELFYTTESKIDEFIVNEEKRNFSYIKDIPDDSLIGHFELVNNQFKTNFYKEEDSSEELRFKYERLSSVISTLNFKSINNQELKKDIELLQKSVTNFLRTPKPKKSYRKSNSKSKIYSKKLQTSKSRKKYSSIPLRQYDQGRYISLISNEGYLLLLRSTLINNKRALQGILYVAQELFRKNLIKNYQNKKFSEFSSFEFWTPNKMLLSSSRIKITGSYSIERNLDALVHGLRVVLSINDIPQSDSYIYLIVILMIVMIVILISFSFIYKSGLAQIELAEQRENFVSAVGHELKTPLTSISMYIEMLQSQIAGNEEQKQSYYDYISQETQRLSRLINNILKLSKINKNNLTLNKDLLSSSEISKLIKNKTSKLISAHGFELELKEQTTEFEIDTELFVQVIFNLVDNALKFSRDTKKKKIEISIETDRIIIRDYGPGVSEEKLSNLFTMFYRAESELTRTTNGTGIGLSLVKKIMAAHNADVEIQNVQPGFQVNLIFQVPSTHLEQKSK